MGLDNYFPYLEVNTIAKMRSTVYLLNGGIVAETGSGGTAPGLITGEKGIEGLKKSNHFIWDDLGEAVALAGSLKHLSSVWDHAQARVLGDALEKAIKRYVRENKSPSPDGLDTRQSQ